MAIAAGFEPITAAVSGAASLPKLHLHRPSTPPTISFRTALIFSPISSRSPRRRTPAMPLFSGGGDGRINGMGNSGGGSGGDDAVGGGGGGINGMGNSGGGSGGDDAVGGGGGHDDKNNKKAAVLVLAERGRSLESVPKDLAAAIESGKIPAAILEKYLELEKSAVFRWLLQFGCFRERLLADDLFLAKVGMECGVGIFTKTAAEYERRRENFSKELDVVIADIVMAITEDFMLVGLPASTVSPRPPPAVSAGAIAKFFHSCPENAFQVALAGTSFSFLKRIGEIVRNGSKLFAVGTTSSLVGTLVANAIINARKAVDSSSAGEVEDVPVSSTSVAYVVLMASSNLRYQGLAGVVEQRILEPMLHKLLLSALCFAVRTGKTFLGSLLWVDYAFRRIMSGIRSIFYVWLWVLGYN